MKRFYIYRHGSHADNQPMNPGPVHVATVTADDRRQALELARDHVTCYANQFLSTMPADQVIAGQSENAQQVVLVAPQPANNAEPQTDHQRKPPNR
jgi:hypothetical protein